MPGAPIYLWTLTEHERTALLFVITDYMAPSRGGVEVHIDVLTGHELQTWELFSKLMALEPHVLTRPPLPEEEG